MKARTNDYIAAALNGLVTNGADKTKNSAEIAALAVKIGMATAAEQERIEDERSKQSKGKD